MTEQEAKELIKYINEEYFYYDKEGEFDEINEALDMAISALEELQQYRELDKERGNVLKKLLKGEWVDTNDLISRSALLEDFRNTITERSDTFDWLNMINRQPTAYDVDKVVEHLEDKQVDCSEA